MSSDTVRSKRLRKKLYLEEYAILGFEFHCKINLNTDTDYEQFFDSFADQVDALNLVVSLDGDNDRFTGFVTSGERYGSATEADRTAIAEALKAHVIISEVETGPLIDAFYND